MLKCYIQISNTAVGVSSLWEFPGLVPWPQELMEEGGTQLEAVGEESSLLTHSTPGWARNGLPSFRPPLSCDQALTAATDVAAP